MIDFRELVAERQDAEAEHYAQDNYQPQPVPEVGEEKLTQILCYFHNHLYFVLNYKLMIFFHRLAQMRGVGSQVLRRVIHGVGQLLQLL